MLKNADVNFDEYDKSDDPQDYKFVRWLTKEKVLSFLLLLTFTLIITVLFWARVNMRPYSNLGSKVPCVGVGAWCWGWFFLSVKT